jgi:hypothetical protein
VWWSGSAVGGGRGEITRATLLGALGAAEALDWAPAPRSAQAHAATAARVAANGAAVRATPVPQIDSGRCDRLGAVIYRPATPEERGWLARWTIAYLSGTGQIGDSAGSVAGVVELAPDGQTVVATGPTADRVQAEYQRLTGGEVYQAGEVTAWLGQRIVAAGGVRLGPGYYVPARSRAQVTRVADALSAVWGSSWLTGLPVATSEQMLAGLAGGLAAEVTEIVAEVDGVGAAGRGHAAAPADRGRRPRGGLRRAARRAPRRHAAHHAA